MRRIVIAGIMLVVCLGTMSSAEHLKRKSVLFRGSAGYGWVSGGAVRETEEEIADAGGFVVWYSTPGGGTESEPIRYRFGGIQGNLEATYMVRPNWGFGGYFRYRGLNQGIITDVNLEDDRAVSFMTINCFGPQLALYFPNPSGLDFFGTAALGIARGTITRIAYLEENNTVAAYDALFSSYNEPLEMAGMYFALEGSLIKFWFNGFCADISLRYDMYYLTIEEEPWQLTVTGYGNIEYPQNSVHNSIGIGIGVGFASHVQKNIPR